MALREHSSPTTNEANRSKGPTFSQVSTDERNASKSAIARIQKLRTQNRHICRLRETVARPALPQDKRTVHDKTK
jgi:hypothetical protein